MSEAIPTPNPPPESERAAMAPAVVGFPGPISAGACPICGVVLRGRQKVACCDAHRAAWSRRRRALGQAEREEQLRAFADTAGEALAEIRRLLGAAP